MEEPIFKTKRFTFNSVFLLIFIITFAIIAISILSSSISNKPDKALIIVGAILGFMAMGFYYLFSRVIKIYKIFTDRIVVYSFWGFEKDQLHVNEIKSWTENELRGRDGMVYYLTLYADNHKIKIDSNNMGNEPYNKIKAIMTINIPEDIRLELKKSIKMYRQSVIVPAIVIIFFTVLGLVKFNYSGLNNLKTGIITKDSFPLKYAPSIHYNEKGKGSLTFFVKSPEDKIVIDDYVFDAIDLAPIRDSLFTRDSIFIDYVTPVHSGFMEKNFGNNDKMVCGLSLNRKHTMLNFDRLMVVRYNSNMKVNYILGGMVLAFIIMIFVYANKIKNKKAELADLKEDNPVAWRMPETDRAAATRAIVEKKAEKTSLKDFVSFFIPIGSHFTTSLIIDLNLLVFVAMIAAGLGFISFDTNNLLAWGANYRPYTEGHNEWWRLLTSTFLHGGILHVLMNMYALFFVGILLEPVLGKTRFAIIYLLTGIVASFASMYINDPIVSVGASGAIFGMYGVFFAFLLTRIFPQAISKSLLSSTIIFIGYNLVIGFAGKGTDNSAHVGGLVSGFLIGLLLTSTIKTEQEEKSQENQTIITGS